MLFMKFDLNSEENCVYSPTRAILLKGQSQPLVISLIRLIYQVSIMTLASTVIKKSSFKVFPHTNIFRNTFGLDV